MYITKVKLPAHFYNITHPLRWFDEFSSPSGDERLILTPLEISRKVRRNEAYARWLHLFRLKLSVMKFQAIRVHHLKHSESNKLDWWDNYRDSAFRVFVNPHTIYDNVTGEHKQWYILSPEDCELVNRSILERTGATLPPRDPLSEPFYSTDKRLRQARVIPVECAVHVRHETFAGRLPDGL